MTIFQAKYIYPVDQPPIKNGAIQINDNTNIIEFVGTAKEALRRGKAGEEIYNFQKGTLLPHIFNAHSHLELGGIISPLGTPGIEFTDWIGLLRQYQQSSFYNPNLAIRKSLSRTLNPINRFFSVTHHMSDSTDDKGSKAFDFMEFIGWTPERINRNVESVSGMKELNSPWGIAPHAPYTVGKTLWEKSIEIARNYNTPIMTHLAETQEELDFLQSGTGSIAKMMHNADSNYDINSVRLGSTPLAYLEFLSQTKKVIIAHGGYFSDEEIAFLGEHSKQFSVVYCPRTHDYFKRKEYPLKKMLDAGVNLCLGTDSRASSPDEQIVNELMYFRKKHPEVPFSQALKLITLNPAKAIGQDNITGTISVGKTPSIVVVEGKPSWLEF